MYYIFNKNGVCVCCCDYEVDQNDLASREETLIKSENIYDASKIKLENGVIIEIVPALEELKSDKINEFKFKRDSLEVEPISYQGYRFDYNDKARDRISAAIISLDITGQSIEWTTADNTNVLVTADDLRGVIAAVALRSNDLHIKYRELKEQVLACSTAEEVAEIVW